MGCGLKPAPHSKTGPGRLSALLRIIAHLLPFVQILVADFSAEGWVLMLMRDTPLIADPSLARFDVSAVYASHGRDGVSVDRLYTPGDVVGLTARLELS
jgi:hypothetical protein